MAAGLGFKDFVTGEVLTAADVDGYLMQGVWVFASAAARDAAVTSPQEGNFAYLKDTNVTTYYTGSAWANLDTTGMTNPMTTTGDTIYSSSGSTPARLGIGTTGQILTVAGGVPSWATPAGGSGMSLVQRSSFSNVANTGSTFKSVFTTTYAVYYVVLEKFYAATSSDSLQVQFANGATTYSTNTYYISNARLTNNTVSWVNLGGDDQNQIRLTDNAGDADRFVSGTLEFYNFATGSSSYPHIVGHLVNDGVTGNYVLTGVAGVAQTFDGFVLKSSSSNVSGTVAVYGLAK